MQWRKPHAKLNLKPHWFYFVASAQPGQFIEVYNPTSTDLDLAGWVVKVLLFQPSGVTTVSPYQVADLGGTIPSGNVYTVCLGLEHDRDASDESEYCCCDSLAIVGNMSQFNPRADEADPGSHIDRVYLEDGDGNTVDRFGPT